MRDKFHRGLFNGLMWTFILWAVMYGWWQLSKIVFALMYHPEWWQ